ncbi:hypothetical protein ACHAXA_007330 [Cyclostephanos tholiformis]|uniref:VDE lipocalin domain-containing protein n=1 Tax=Cyclostephanos tholiformis TaxID=382380 RepID=A0ABD3R3X3_9STRA
MIPISTPCRLLAILALTAGFHYRSASSFSFSSSSSSASLPPRRSYPASKTPRKAQFGPPRSSLEVKAISAPDNDNNNDDDDVVIVANYHDDDAMIGTVALLVPSSSSAISEFGIRSPISSTPPSYAEVAAQLARKIAHFSDGRIIARVVHPPPSSSSSSDHDHDDDVDGIDESDGYCLDSDALFAIGLTSPSDVRYLSRTFRKDESRCPRGGAGVMDDDGEGEEGGGIYHSYAPIVGPYDAANASPLLTSLTPWSDVASGSRLATQMMRLFDETSTDEFALATMLYFDRFSNSGIRVPWVMHSIDVTWEKGPIRNAREVYDMLTKCGPCIVRCLADENCSSCIRALDVIDTRDQVNSYRTVVSYESELLRDFSLCILTKNNVFGCEASIPTLPVVKPLGYWRGKELTANVARTIMIGHLRGATTTTTTITTAGDYDPSSMGLDVSWKVACGANAAYDQFPSQNQLFYPTARGNDLWYDPVFRVETIDGRNVWCKRHYRVRNGRIPGTFRFSVLDNGVTSDEFWTILGAADDLTWVVFHYAGAAAAVGQRYIGGLLCTPDGRLPPPEDLDEIWRIFRSAEIEPWELFVVDNDESSAGALAAGPPPLDYYRKSTAIVVS